MPYVTEAQAGLRQPQSQQRELEGERERERREREREKREGEEGGQGRGKGDKWGEGGGKYEEKRGTVNRNVWDRPNRLRKQKG